MGKKDRKKSKNQNQSSTDRETYLDYRRQLVEGLYEGSKQYDAALLSLSSGAFILSVAFIADLPKELTPTLIYLLKSSWVSFAATIIIVLASFRVSQHAFHAQMDNLDKAYKECDDSILENQPPSVRIIKWLNYFAGIAFLIAVIFTVLFAVNSI